MSTLYMMVGLPASGKSLMAKTLDAVVRSSDDLRESLLKDINDMSENDSIFTFLHSLVRSDLYCGGNVVYDATNLKARYRKEFLDTLNILPCKKVCIFMDTPTNTCLARNSARKRRVPTDVIERMAKYLEAPTLEEGWDEIWTITVKDLAGGN